MSIEHLKLLGTSMLRAGTAAALAVALLLPTHANAAPPVVKTVPWVATNPLIAHDTYPGKAVTLKGTSDIQGANVTYRWSFGDGTPDVTGTVSNRWAIEAAHTYAGAVGDLWAATLTVTNTSTAETSTATYLVQMRAKSLAVEANVAIDEGLWYLHKTAGRSTSSGKDYASWTSGCTGVSCAGYSAVTGANVSAFFVNGHRVDGATTNPYTETVQRAMRTFFGYLSVGTTSLMTYTAGSYGAALGTHDPDCEACAVGDPSKNGRYLFISGSDVYQTGIMTAALASSGTPTAVADTGVATYVNGRTYRAILQDMVDYWAFAQSHTGTTCGFGGWHYTADYEDADNSTAQWGAISLLAAEGFGKAQYGAADPGIKIATVLRQANPYWLSCSFQSFACTGGTCGAFGYDRAGYYPWGPYATTPSGLVQLAFSGLGRGGADLKWERTEKYLRQQFPNGGNAGSAIKNYYYGLYAFVKAMLLHVNETTGLREPITLLDGDLDWYAAEVANGAPTDGVARTLINAQRADKGWSGHYYTGEQSPFETSWAIQMLNRTITESGAPVAVAKAIPNPAVAGGVVTLDGTASFHQDPTKAIVKWDWDLYNDGSYDGSGPVVNWTVPNTLGNYQVKLRVTDNFGTPATNDTVITVQVSVPPLAPTAKAGGPYNFCPASKPWFLDGSGSVNPDEGVRDPACPACPGDTIVSYEWDLDVNGTYDLSGKTTDVTTYFEGRGVGDYNVRLRTTDRTDLAFPGRSALSSTDTAQVHVLAANDIKCTGCTVVSKYAAGKQVQLTWASVASAAGYAVYRSTVNGGPYTKFATVPATQLMYIDANTVVGTTYYWVIRPLAANLEELCQSNQVSQRIAGR